MGATTSDISTHTAKPTSIEYCQKLVSAYIEQIDDVDCASKIPREIIELCVKYYRPFTIMLWLTHSPTPTGTHHDNALCITDINNPSKSWRSAAIYDLHSSLPASSSSLPSSPLTWNLYCNSVCFAKNVRFIPPQITDYIFTKHYKMRTNMNSKLWLQTNPYHILFKSEGLNQNQLHASDQCNAIIFNHYEFLNKQSNDDKITCFHWKLPNLPIQLYGNNFVFSNVFGLLSIGGIVDGMYLSQLFNLSFDHIYDMHDGESSANWKWTNLPSMHFARYLPSSTMIDYDKAIVVGGYNGVYGFLNCVEMFDFSEQKWSLLSNLSYERNQSGILFSGNKVYVGGGRSDDLLNIMSNRQEIEYLDLHSNKWLHDIPNPNQIHSRYPQIWKDGHNPNILCIASIQNSNCMEYIDLRIHNKTWHVLYDQLSAKFGIDPANNFSEFCKLCV